MWLLLHNMASTLIFVFTYFFSISAINRGTLKMFCAFLYELSAGIARNLFPLLRSL